ncbi:MAG: hypothetical protein JF888_10855 [Candidatus Dormibacteraeota bacterium]|uniref:Glycoside hydrolase n=1 Tax=Candidatus Dormiibacter inghamiae TaxID=3127013 RepID=A0A934KIY7_9BACT|nr:hypothetical protein [Candidatus Dormibacteraeota bacterium]MBJ7607305.1 hypothetical protein [Candidatus Dormibacteraeota bacterium]
MRTTIKGDRFFADAVTDAGAGRLVRREATRSAQRESQVSGLPGSLRKPAMWAIGLALAAAGCSSTAGVGPPSAPQRAGLSVADRPEVETKPTTSPSPTPVAVQLAPRAAGARPGAAKPSAGARSTSAPARRGVYRFNSEAWPAMAAAGFNAATDGGVASLGQAEAAAGLNGMVWVPAYDNRSCQQTMSDAAIAAVVTDNVRSGYGGLTYQIGDEPTANGCAAAPVYSHLTALVHSADPRAQTWVADDQFNDPDTGHWPAGVPMNGTVDVLAFDVYPCQSGACDYGMIDQAVKRIHQAGVAKWEFILQDFNASSWRWPSPPELRTQFEHWQHQGASGYWIFAWDYQDGNLADQAGHVAALQWINRQPV